MSDGLVRVSPLAKVGSAGASVAYTQDVLGNLVQSPVLFDWLMKGHLFVAGDSTENATITGRTSYAATTPDLLLDVPAGKTVIPLWLDLTQAGTVAGGVITVHVSIDRVVRYSSGGTSESITAMRTDRLLTSGVKAYSSSGSAITAAAATDARALWSQLLDFDVTDPNTTESVHLLAFRDFIPPMLVGAASLLVFTLAATTGMTAHWSLGWAEFDTTAFAQS